MKNSLTILLILFCLQASAQSAEAGNDQTIYLSQTNTVALGGSSFGTTFLWREISTDFSSGGNIVTPTGVTTNVNNLYKQGTFYFEIAATTGGTTRRDTVMVKVDYDVPVVGTVLRTLTGIMPGLSTVVNNYSDTVTFFDNTNDPSHLYTRYTEGTNKFIYIDRARTLGMNIDSSRGKVKSTVEDVYQWDNAGYNRTELSYGSGWLLDSSKNYVFEWKGYFPQPITDILTNVLVIFQLHPLSGSPYFSFRLDNSNLNFSELNTAGNGTGSTITFLTPILPVSELYNQSHTIRLTLKEGMNGTVKVEVDGVQKYLRNTGQVGGTWGSDYPKFASIYDSQEAVVSPDSTTRKRKFSLVTENFTAYEVASIIPPPTVNAGPDKTITTDTTTLTGTATAASGQTITSTTWSKISGGTVGILNAGSLTANISGMTDGEYIFQLEANQSDGQVTTDQVKVTVNINTPPVIVPIPNSILKMPGNWIILENK